MVQHAESSGPTASGHEESLHAIRARRGDGGVSQTRHDGSHDEMSHAEMVRKWMWRDFVNMTLGAWLVCGAFTVVHDEPRMFWSDLISGAVIMALSALVLWPRFELLRWGLCFVGIWLLFAPLVFWTRDAGAYSNDTLVGSLVIAFSVLIPMMPSAAHHRVMMMGGPDIPPGWSYNPSDWIQRGPIIAMALLGFFLSRYLAAYQLGHIPYPWDPFFGDGTRRVLDSDVSKAWPVSDAGLGAVSYMLEALSGFMGGRNRWRTMPWMVAMFGLLVVPLGIVSIVLVVLQPIAVGSWCTLCLITAGAMLVMITPAVDEVIAMCQFLGDARRERKPFWRTFWVGGTLDRYSHAGQSETDARGDAPKSTLRRIIAAMDLNNVPLNLLGAAAVGIWIMAAPGLLASSGAAASSDHLTGALIVTFSVIAFGEVMRPARFLNIALGIWLMAAPWMLSGESPAARWNDMIAGAIVVLLSLRKGTVTERFGTWNRRIV